MPKATKAEISERVNVVFTLLVSGATHHEILHYVAKNTDWGVNSRQIENYIAKANGAITAKADFHRAHELGRAIERLHDLYKRAMKVMDFKGALSVQKELNTLLALYAPPARQVVQIIGPDALTELERLQDLTNAKGHDLAQLFEAMIAQYADADAD